MIMLKKVIVIALMLILLPVAFAISFTGSETPPPIILNNKTNISINHITANGMLINGNLTVIGSYVNASVVNQYLNGTFSPSTNSVFNIGTPTMMWNNVYANTFYGAWNGSSLYVPYNGATGNVDLGQHNMTATYFFGNGSQLTDLPMGGNSSWNESYANTLYAGIEWDYNQTSIGQAPYLYSVGVDMYLNETKLNETIDDRSGGGAVSCSSTGYIGSNLTGLDGEVNRTFLSDADMIGVDSSILHPDIDYTITAGTIKFLSPIWDDMDITIWLCASYNSTNNVGADCSGFDGDSNRMLLTSNANLIVVDNSLLHLSIDYTKNSTSVVFLNPMWDDMIITVWRN